MLKEIETARLSEERKTFQREGQMMATDRVWIKVFFTCGTKKAADLKSEVVDATLQITGSDCDPEDILEQHPAWT